MTAEDLMNAGYRYYRMDYSPRHTEHLYQKCIHGPEGNRLYFISVWHYPGLYESLPPQDGFQFDTNFRMPNSRHLNLTFHGFPEIAEAEEFFAFSYERPGALPYEGVQGD